MKLFSCPKNPDSSLDKSLSPAATVERVLARMEELGGKGIRLLGALRRVDTGRLGIPVFMSLYGPEALALVPTRKQMGKGSTPDQARASALMELMERFAFFSYWQQEPAAYCTWSEARQRFGSSLLPLTEIIASVHDPLPPDAARQALDLWRWEFRPAWRIADAEQPEKIYAPLSWFRLLNEFNGASAGNTPEESLLQGTMELIERHVCCRLDRERPRVPAIDANPTRLRLLDPVLADMVSRFAEHGIRLLLYDISLGLPVPTVAALAWDPASFPERSEIVFTAGSATSPEKAALRAVTEVAQLGGDFITASCYEASGLPKFASLEEIRWLTESGGSGLNRGLETLPRLEHADIREELFRVSRGLNERGVYLYAADTTTPLTGIPSHYCFAPGLEFRERDANASLGLFIGRQIAEQEEDGQAALEKIRRLDELYGGGQHWAPFFQGLALLRMGETAAAEERFHRAIPLQPDAPARALAVFYLAYAASLREDWQRTAETLDEAIRLDPGVKEYRNLRGAAYFRMERFAPAAEDFSYIIKYLDKGSAVDLANLGFCHARLGNEGQAREYLEALLEIDPDHQKAREWLARHALGQH